MITHHLSIRYYLPHAMAFHSSYNNKLHVYSLSEDNPKAGAITIQAADGNNSRILIVDFGVETAVHSRKATGWNRSSRSENYELSDGLIQSAISPSSIHWQAILIIWSQSCQCSWIPVRSRFSNGFDPWFNQQKGHFSGRYLLGWWRSKSGTVVAWTGCERMEKAC